MVLSASEHSVKAGRLGLNGSTDRSTFILPCVLRWAFNQAIYVIAMILKFRHDPMVVSGITPHRQTTGCNLSSNARRSSHSNLASGRIESLDITKPRRISYFRSSFFLCFYCTNTMGCK